ncbi:MAG: hypothetical protein V7749_01180 [Cocleimonas sp.]
MYRTILFLISFLFVGASQAEVIDNDSKLIYNKIFEIAKEKGVDPLVFAAIILHESGDPKRYCVINPYALNLGGFSYYPNSKLEAYKMLIEAVMRGENQLGVGAGQIEWVWHKDKFNSLWDALNLDKNLNESAIYYSKMIELCDGESWCGVGKYHNRDPKIGLAYSSKVKKKWTTLKELFLQE